MGEVLSDLLPFALTVAISPVPIIACRVLPQADAVIEVLCAEFEPATVG
jgi:hypothetical protein